MPVSLAQKKGYWIELICSDLEVNDFLWVMPLSGTKMIGHLGSSSAGAPLVHFRSFFVVVIKVMWMKVVVKCRPVRPPLKPTYGWPSKSTRFHSTVECADWDDNADVAGLSPPSNPTCSGTARIQRWCHVDTERTGNAQLIQPPEKCPMCYLLSQKGSGGVERPLFLSFVYARSGSTVIAEQRSLGMVDIQILTSNPHWIGR